MDAEESEAIDSADDYEISLSENSHDTEEDDEEEDDEEDDEENVPENPILGEDKVLETLQVFDEEVKGKEDTKQSIIVKSTKNAFIRYLQQVTEKNTQPCAIVDKCEMNRVVRELIMARGFIVLGTPVPKKYASLKPLMAPKRNAVVGVKENQKDRLCVFFGKSGKLGVQMAREIETCISKHKITQVVIVTTEKMTPVAIESLSSLPCIMHFFDVEELLKNYTLHALLPKQEALSKTEEKMFLKQKRIKKTEMPQMSRIDPIVKFHGWQVGSIIKCTRTQGETCEPHVAYRIVC
jgi:DNA-directed RNA polymerase subunit H (RpoH/RPB5)